MFILYAKSTPYEKTSESPNKNKTLYGMIAYVDTKGIIAEQALKNGFFLAKISEEQFELTIPEVPKQFNLS